MGFWVIRGFMEDCFVAAKYAVHSGEKKMGGRRIDPPVRGSERPVSVGGDEKKPDIVERTDHVAGTAQRDGRAADNDRTNGKSNATPLRS